MKNAEKIVVYKKLLDTCSEHAIELAGDDLFDNISALESKIKICELSQLFDIDFDVNGSHMWQRIGYDDNRHLCFIDGVDRKISWPDNDIQPNNEYLYKIGFSTGAYTFSQSYPTETFKAFFSELKTYNPKYIDSANKCLYFDHTTAKKVHENYKEIFNKYAEMVADENKLKRMEKLKIELAALEQSK